MPYNPFNKSIGTPLEADDLNALIENAVAEGYHVEYKRELPVNEKIGKSIAALANTYGGWYIIGVETDRHNVAQRVSGFSLATLPDPISTLRDVVKSHVVPVPIFYPQVVKIGPDRAILVVYVPGEQDTPFISKDGRIYRRIADSSEPVYEKDRYAVDELYERGRKNAKNFKRFCRDERIFSKAESGGWVNIFLSPYPYGIIDKYSILIRENFEKILQSTQVPLDISFDKGKTVIGQGNISFNSGQFTHRSVILRSVFPSRVAFNSLTIELFIDGSAKFFIPLPYCFSQSKGLLPDNLQSSRDIQSPVVKTALQKFIANDSEHSIQYLHFFNIGQLWATMALLLNFYLDWLGMDLPLLTDMKMALTFSNVWRSVPFVDMEDWGMHIEKFGLPIIFAENIDVPEDIGQGLIINMDDINPLWSQLTHYIGLTVGLPSELLTAAVLNALLKIDKIPPEWMKA